VTLTFGFATARDVLRKAQRDYQRLSQAAQSSEELAVADSLFDFAVTVFHVQDWLKTHAGPAFAPQDVDQYVRNSVALSAFHDLCTASKHREITRYPPSTSEVAASAVAQVSSSLGSSTPQVHRKTFVTKVVGTDQVRREAVSLADQALKDWEAFFGKHGL
jgi:hypothetical protein